MKALSAYSLVFDDIGTSRRRTQQHKRYPRQLGAGGRCNPMQQTWHHSGKSGSWHSVCGQITRPLTSSSTTQARTSSNCSFSRVLVRQRDMRVCRTLIVWPAGIFPERKVLTADGFEQTWAVNVLAPFLLTSLLVDAVKERIVNVSSISAGSRIDFDNLNQVSGAHGLQQNCSRCSDSGAKDPFDMYFCDPGILCPLIFDRMAVMALV